LVWVDLLFALRIVGGSCEIVRDQQNIFSASPYRPTYL
jgi:hypothetical protein